MPEPLSRTILELPEPDRPTVAVTVGRAALYALGLMLVLYAVEFWDFTMSLMFQGRAGGMLDQFGIRPRKLPGLPGILFAPFLHRDFHHLAANSLPLVSLSFILLMLGTKRFFAASAIITLVTGAGVWLLADIGRPHTVHIGASGLVFGYLGFLLFKGFFERRPAWIVVSVLLAIIYAGYLHGLLPGRPGVSWLSHFFGFLSGILASWLLAERPEETSATVRVIP